MIKVFDVDAGLHVMRLEGHDSPVKMVRYGTFAEKLASMDEDVERVYRIGVDERYELLFENE